jgi:pantoate--beta-alanine ligase
MKIVRSARELRAALDGGRATGTVGFVPTMGALHEGHLSLIRAARATTGVVVVSIFVNPLQFGPNEDFDAYPRAEATDLEFARAEGADVVFVPAVEEIYPKGDSTIVSAGALGAILEGEDRPGHFDGVCTVVAKLFNLVGPDVAFFGQKDAQQAAVIKRMVTDLHFDLEIVVGPTVREADGLALSSRNRYLTEEQRHQATALYEALRLGAELVDKQELEATEKNMWDLISERGLLPGYARVVDPDTFTPALPDGSKLLVVAAKLGNTRLIDNLLMEG